MILYPEIEILGGRCVTSATEDRDAAEVHAPDPLDAALAFAEAGAEWLHVVDLDAVAGRSGVNAGILRRILQNVTIPVQVGGGLRSMEAVDRWLGEGADCVVMASAAVRDPRFAIRACTRHPFRVLIGIDVSRRRVMADGRLRRTGHRPFEFARLFDDHPLAGIIVTDIDFDRRLPDASFALVARMARELTSPVIASGFVETIDHLSTLKHLETVAGAVVGRPLYCGGFTLYEALSRVWGSAPERLWWRRSHRIGERPR